MMYASHDFSLAPTPAACSWFGQRLSFLSVLLLTAIVHAAAPLNDLLPHDTLAFIELDPSAPQAAANQSALLDLSVEALRSTGILSRKAGEVGDILALASAAGSHHSCLALLDADLAAIDNDLECRSVQLAWVLDTGGHSNDMVDRLTGLLTHLSSRKTAQQSIHKTPEEKRQYVEFRDASWPAWLTLDWSQQGNYFILTLGQGAMDHYLAERPVGGVPWEQTLADADAAAAKQNSTGKVFTRIYVAPAGFRERFPEPMKKTLLGQLFQTLDLAMVDASVFSARSQNRAISMDNATTTAGVLTDTPWTVPFAPNSPLLKLVPPEATAYLALNIQWPAVFTRFTALLDAVIPDGSGRPANELISEFASRQHVKIQADILAQLQPIVVIHDAPQHPLRLPLMVTAIAATDPAAQSGVKSAFTTLITALADDLARKSGASHDPAAGYTHLQIRTDPDGVAYLQFGLVGPAWFWTGNRLVFSWSPAAVRSNIAAASTIAPGAFTPSK